MAIHKIGGKTTESTSIALPHNNLQEVLHVITIEPFMRNSNITLTTTNIVYFWSGVISIPSLEMAKREGVSYDVKWVDYGSVFPSRNNNLEVPDSILDISDFHRNGLYFHDGTNIVHCRFHSQYSPRFKQFYLNITLRCIAGSYTFNPRAEFLSAVFPAHSKRLQVIITNSSGSIEVGDRGAGGLTPSGRFYFSDGSIHDVSGELTDFNQGGPFEFFGGGWRYTP